LLTDRVNPHETKKGYIATTTEGVVLGSDTWDVALACSSKKISGSPYYSIKVFTSANELEAEQTALNLFERDLERISKSSKNDLSRRYFSNIREIGNLYLIDIDFDFDKKIIIPSVKDVNIQDELEYAWIYTPTIPTSDKIPRNAEIKKRLETLAQTYDKLHT
jgi:hypothetical protein